MSKFIEINDTIINIDDVRRIEFLGDDIYLGLFPKGEDGKLIGDYVSFDFAKIYTFDGNVVLISIDLYPPEDGEIEDEWINRNRAYIGQFMEEIYSILKPFKVDGKEYAD